MHRQGAQRKTNLLTLPYGGTHTKYANCAANPKPANQSFSNYPGNLPN